MSVGDKDGNDELREHGFEIMPEEKVAEGTTHVTFFGAVRYVPEMGERVELRAADGSWRSGYRATSEVTTDDEYPGEDVVWISTEEEWNTAASEGRASAGAPWPLAQMRSPEER